MATYKGPKNKLSRREGMDLFNKGEKLRRAEIPPGMHGKKTGRKQSDYGRQLRSKQKAKRMYGIMEKQFRNYVLKAYKTKGNVGAELVTLVERRLDNTLYRLGIVPTRRSARQLISHGHVMINGLRVNIPSYSVNVGDVIGLDPKVEDNAAIRRMEEIGLGTPPEWLERKDRSGKVIRMPEITDLKEPISIVDIIEFYSR